MFRYRPILREGEIELPVHSVRESETALDEMKLRPSAPVDFFEVDLPASLQDERFGGNAHSFGEVASHIHVAGSNNCYGMPKYRLDLVGENLVRNEPGLYRMRSYLVFPKAAFFGRATLQTIDAELVNDRRKNQSLGGELPRAQDIDDLYFLASAISQKRK